MSQTPPDRSGSALPVLGAVAVGVVAVAIALLWPQPRTSLTQPSSGLDSGTSRIQHSRPATGYRIVAEPICVNHGTVTISDVRPHAPLGGIHIVDWAVSAPTGSGPPSEGSDATIGRAREVRGYAKRAVSASCDEPQYLAIAVDRSSNVAIAHGFDVSSSSGAVLIQHTVELCAASCP